MLDLEKGKVIVWRIIKFVTVIVMFFKEAEVMRRIIFVRVLC